MSVLEWAYGRPSPGPGGERYYLEARHNDVLYTICKTSHNGVWKYTLTRGKAEVIGGHGGFDSNGAARRAAEELIK